MDGTAASVEVFDVEVIDAQGNVLYVIKGGGRVVATRILTPRKRKTRLSGVEQPGSSSGS